MPQERQVSARQSTTSRSWGVCSAALLHPRPCGSGLGTSINTYIDLVGYSMTLVTLDWVLTLSHFHLLTLLFSTLLCVHACLSQERLRVKKGSHQTLKKKPTRYIARNFGWRWGPPRTLKFFEQIFSYSAYKWEKYFEIFSSCPSSLLSLISVVFNLCRGPD